MRGELDLRGFDELGLKSLADPPYEEQAQWAVPSVYGRTRAHLRSPDQSMSDRRIHDCAYSIRLHSS